MSIFSMEFWSIEALFLPNKWYQDVPSNLEVVLKPCLLVLSLCQALYQAALEIFESNLLKYNVTDFHCEPCYKAAGISSSTPSRMKTMGFLPVVPCARNV